MRFALGCLILIQLASGGAAADEPRVGPIAKPPVSAARSAANRLFYSGIGVLAVGVVATIVSQVLVGEAWMWSVGNGLGEHYDPTPAWVPTYETAGWMVLAGGQAAIISGIVMLSVGASRRHRARAPVSLSFGVSRAGGFVAAVAHF